MKFNTSNFGHFNMPSDDSAHIIPIGFVAVLHQVLTVLRIACVVVRLYVTYKIRNRIKRWLARDTAA